MNTELKIQEILSRATPVNDNTGLVRKDVYNRDDITGRISIIGNHNIVIESGIFSFLAIAAFIYSWILLLVK